MPIAWRTPLKSGDDDGEIKYSIKNNYIIVINSVVNSGWKTTPYTNRPTCNVTGLFFVCNLSIPKNIYIIMLGWLVFNNEGEIVKGVPANTTTTRKASPFKTHFTVIFRKSYRSDQSDASDGCQISLYIFLLFNPRRDCYMTPKPHHTIRGQTTCAPRGAKFMGLFEVRRTEKTAHI